MGNVEEIQELCKTSLYFLCTEILGYKDWDKCHDDLELFLSKPSSKKLIMLPRGHLKTAIVTKAFVIQTLLKNPDARILIANQVWDKAREMLYEIKQFLEDKSELHKIFGDFRSPKWREDDVVIRQRKKALASPSIGTCGVETELTSSHYDLIIADDLVGLSNSQTKEQREKVKKFKKLLNSLLDPGSMEINIGTRWHFDDYYNDILTGSREYYDVMIRCVVEDGRVIFPKKFNLKFNPETKEFAFTPNHCLDYINFLKKSMGSEFYAQYMNNPVDEDTAIYKRSYLQYWTKKPNNLFIAMTVDPALSSIKSRDYTAIVTCGMDDEGKIYVLDYLQGRWDQPSKIIEQIFDRAEKFKPNVIGIESNNWQTALKWWADKMCQEQGKNLPIIELRADNRVSKEYRMKALEPAYANHQVFHAHWMKGKDLEDQILSFTSEGVKSAHDDLLDALSYQYDLLVPGSTAAGITAPIGSWEWEAEAARSQQTLYKDFFKE